MECSEIIAPLYPTIGHAVSKTPCPSQSSDRHQPDDSVYLKAAPIPPARENPLRPVGYDSLSSTDHARIHPRPFFAIARRGRLWGPSVRNLVVYTGREDRDGRGHHSRFANLADLEYARTLHRGSRGALDRPWPYMAAWIDGEELATRGLCHSEAPPSQIWRVYLTVPSQEREVQGREG